MKMFDVLDPRDLLIYIYYLSFNSVLKISETCKLYNEAPPEMAISLDYILMIITNYLQAKFK